MADVESLWTPPQSTIAPEEDPHHDYDHEQNHQQDRAITPPGPPSMTQPFEFSSAPPPTYTAAGNTPNNVLDRPLAVPQTHPKTAAPFLPAYPVTLLSYGIPQSTWQHFLQTLSSLLTAHIGKTAMLHATKVAQDYGDMHINLGKEIASHTGAHLRDIAHSARRGNPLAIVGSAVSWQLGIVSSVVGTVLAVPGALVQRAQTPRERADAYVAAANAQWFNARGLHAVLGSTAHLAEIVKRVGGEWGHDGGGFFAALQACKNAAPAEQMDVLRPWIGEVVVEEVDAVYYSPASGTSPATGPPSPAISGLVTASAHTDSTSSTIPSEQRPALTPSSSSSTPSSSSPFFPPSSPPEPLARRVSSFSTPSASTTSKGKAKVTSALKPRLQIAARSLWVVLVPAASASAVEEVLERGVRGKWGAGDKAERYAGT